MTTLQTIDTIPHLAMYRQRAFLPTIDKTPSMYSLVFLNAPNAESAADTITLPTIYHNNRFHHMYLDNLYRGNVFNRTYNQNKTAERELIYDQVSKKAPFVQSMRAMSAGKGRNMYVNMQIHNQIFFEMAEKSNTFRRRVEEYFAFLKAQWNDPKYQMYKKKVMLVPVNDWLDHVGASTNTKNMPFNTPIYLFYYALRRMIDQVNALGDMNIIFFSNGISFRLNPSQCNRSSIGLFQRAIQYLSKNRVSLDQDDKTLDDQVRQAELISNVSQSFKTQYKFVGGEPYEGEVDDVVQRRTEELSQDDSLEGLSEEEKEEAIALQLMNDEEMLRDVVKVVQKAKTGRSAISLKRDQELREHQMQLKLDNMSLDELRSTLAKNVTIESNDVSDKVKTTNANITNVRFPNFEKAYNEHLMKKDTLDIIMSLNDRSIPMFVRNIEVNDTSDELNYKETYTVDLEDSNRIRHRLKFDLPKFIDDKFMYLNGNKKIIIKQLFMKPVVKLGPNNVQIATNYKKIFLERYGTKMSDRMEKFRKAVLNTKTGIVARYGNNSGDNNAFKTTLEYDEIGTTLTYLKVGTSEFYFNQVEMQEELTKRKLKAPTGNVLPIGFTTTGPGKVTIITVDLDTHNVVGTESDIISHILSVGEGKLSQAYDEAASGKKFMYTRVSIMKSVIRKQVPLVLLLGYMEGLTSVLRKAGVKYSFSDTRPKTTESQGVVEFANGYMVYEKYPYDISLLMNAFVDIPTKGFNIEELDEKDAYLSIFDSMFGFRNVGNAFDNFYELMIDPITKEVLEDLNYPTGFVELCLFANKLLSDNSFQKENNMDIYRVRSNELVNGYLYNTIATAYSRYRSTANNNNPVKVSVPQDAVIKNLLMAPNVEDYSILNPIVELEKSRAISPKGLSGLNLAQAYTQDKRSYDSSMMGVLAMSTSPDANVGVVRQLTTEPNVIGPRGYIDVNAEDFSGLKDVNLFSPAELLSPLGASRDDTIRTAMATKQSKHIIPIRKSSPVLVSNGSEQVIHYHLSDDFSVVAKHDGEVVEIDEKKGIIIIGYYDKKAGGKKSITSYQAITTSPKVVKNGAGGFYLSIQLESQLKLGQKFKKNDVLAYDKKFFTNSKIDGVRFNIGSIQKVACMSSYSTYEDSTFITKKLNEDMAAEIVMEKSVTLGKNANVDFIVNVGDEIKVGDELMRFEMSFEDNSINKFLDSIGTDLQEDIRSLGRTPIKSKYSGVIEDIKIYSTVDLEELSPSLQKLVSKYYAGINEKKDLLNKYDKSDASYKMGVLLNEPTGKVDSRDGKVKGNDVGEG